MIPYGRQDITQSDIDSIVEVLRSDFLTQGPAVPRFEDAVAARVMAKYAIAVNSATSALHLACLALGLRKGDLLWTVPNTFVASANCARYCDADVDFVDIDSDTWNLSVPALTEKLGRARRAGRVPAVVVPVHFAGQPTEQAAIWELAQQYGFKVLEDASHAVGASRDGEPVGSCRWADITVFSFHPVKIITSGEGGMALTNNRALAECMAMLRSHGVTRDAAQIGSSAARSAFDPPDRIPVWYYEQQMLGYNYRMTDIQAALGSSQLGRLDAYLERRNALARGYDRDLGGLPLQLPRVLPGNQSAFHLYVVRTDRNATGDERGRIFDGLRQRGIGVNVHYMPVHLQPYYRELGFSAGRCPEAEAHGRTALTLPLYPGMTDEEQRQVVLALKDVL